MDLDEIKKRIEYIEKKFPTLSASIKDHETLEDTYEKYKAIKTVERDCEEIVESAVRINQEILSDTGNIGSTYRDSFEQLKKLSLFEQKDLEKLANTTGFRNRLAHDYMDLDEKITIKSAKNILQLYPKYLLKIIEFLG